MKELIHACAVEHRGHDYQVLLIMNNNFTVKAQIIRLEDEKKQHRDLGFHEVTDAFGKITSVPKIVIVELQEGSGENLKKFRNICVNRIRRQFFPRHTVFRVMKK